MIEVVSDGSKNVNPEVTVELDGQEHIALVDSGATSFFIHYDVFKFLHPAEQELTPYHGAVRTADNSALEGILGVAQVNITLTLNGITKCLTTDAIVCKTISYPMILGVRFMSQADLVLHPANQDVYFATAKKAKTENKVHFPDEDLLFACEELTIPARSSTDIKVIVHRQMRKSSVSRQVSYTTLSMRLCRESLFTERQRSGLRS